MEKVEVDETWLVDELCSEQEERETNVVEEVEAEQEEITSRLLVVDTNRFHNIRQVIHLLTKIRDSEELKFTKILSFVELNISRVPPAILSGAISRLEDVRISLSSVTPEQLDAIFTMMAGQFGDSKLKRLMICANDLRSSWEASRGWSRLSLPSPL